MFMNKDNLFVFILLLVIVGMFFIPTGFDKTKEGTIRSKALVLSTNNSEVFQKGIVKVGTQEVKIRVLNGEFKSKEFTTFNTLKGQLELDKIFMKGDKALIVIGHTNDNVDYVNIIDHYRINVELLLFAGFIILLIIFSGWTGFKSVLSFIFTVLMIWKILIPSFLKGFNPIIVSLVVVTLLTAVIDYLIAGLNKKAFVAFLGTFIGIVTTCLFALLFGKYFKIHGAIVPFSESLLYSGYGNLDLTTIFLSGIFIASSGALLDVTMDISAAVYEVVLKKPNITTKEAIKSGMELSKLVIGTMTTTLLLAYSGGYTALLMVFMAQGTPTMNIFNLTYVSGEILHTLVGSFGLVFVGPITALIAGIVFTENHIKEYFKECKTCSYIKNIYKWH